MFRASPMFENIRKKANNKAVHFFEKLIFKGLNNTKVMIFRIILNIKSFLSRNKFTYRLQSEHTNTLNFYLHKHHLLYEQKARICFRVSALTDKPLPHEYKVNPKYLQ